MFVNDFIFKHPATVLVAGPTQSGKTSLIKSILENNQLLISPKPSHIYYAYAEWQTKFDEMKQISPPVQFIQGLPDFDIFNPENNNVLILDDLMEACKADDGILKLFTTDAHHKSITVFLITQNLFTQGKCARSISLNSNYLILLNNPRDRSQIRYLSNQMYPGNTKFLKESYEDSVNNKQYGYLFIDLTQSTDNKCRIQTGILPGQQRLIYVPKSRFF